MRDALTWTWTPLTALLFVCGPWLGTAGAQLPPPGELVGEHLVRLRLPFVMVDATDAQRSAWQASPEWRGVVTTSAGPATVTVNSEELDGDGVNSALNLVLGVERDGRAVYWQPAASPTPDEPGLEQDRHWRLFAVNSPVHIAPAIGAEGMLVVKYAAEFRYNSGGREVTHRVVLDLRPPVPVVVADVLEDVGAGRCFDTSTVTTTACTWDAARQDYRCTETFDDRRRETWLLGQGTVERPLTPGAPRDIGEFVDRLPRPAPAGRWAELPDVGTVRVLADVPSRTRGRRIVLFATSLAMESPLFVVTRDASGTTIATVRDVPAADPTRYAWRDEYPSEYFPAADFRPSGEPPDVMARPVGGRRADGVRLYAVVTAIESGRRLTHVGIEESRDGVYAAAVTAAESGPEYSLFETDVSPCESERTVGPRAVSATARSSPTRLEYVIEPAYEVTGAGPQRPAPDGECELSSTATWRQGAGFEIEVTRGDCPATRFTAVTVTPDGRLVPRRYDVPRR